MPLTPAIATLIINEKLGCRYGETAENAAYCFDDIVGEGDRAGIPTPMQMLQFMQDPQAAAFQPRWDQRLWNTCCCIASLGQTGGPVILVTKASGAGERYRCTGGFAQGDGFSFGKCGKLQPDAQILARVVLRGEEGEEEIQNLYHDLYAALLGLA